MDNIIDLYYENCQENDEFEIIFNSNIYKEGGKYIHKSGLIFESDSYLKQYMNDSNNNKTTATSYNDFNRLISVIRNKYKKVKLTEEYILSIDLMNSNKRIRLLNLDTIKEYCNTDNLPEDNVEYILKERKKIKGGKYISHTNNDYNFRINCKTETPLSSLEITNLKDNFKDLYKSFRFIKRYTLINDTHYPYLKIDCSIVKSKRNFKTLKESNIFKSSPNYEIEIELINEVIMNMKKNGQKIKKNEIKNLVKLVFSTLQNTSYPINISKKSKVLNDYHKLANKNINKAFYRNGCLNNYKSFFGPGSVALQREDLNKDTKNNILKNYCVTDKADGERKFIFIIPENIYNVYLIDMNLGIQFTGLTVNNKELYNTIIDGEHILSEKGEINLFMAFDIYYLNNKMTSNLKFYNKKNPEDKLTRYNLLLDTINKINTEGVIKVINSSNDLKIKCKKFYFTDAKKNIFSCCKDAFDYINSGIEYKTDGLIFTPIHFKLKEEQLEGKYKTEDVRKKNRWKACYKWKEAKENTIDFLIKVKEIKEHRKYRSDDSSFKTKEHVLELYVGDYIMDYKLAFWTNNKNIKAKYDKILFNPTTYNDNGLASYSIIKETNGANGMGIYTENENEDQREYIEDDTIVEFRYDVSDGINSDKNKWIPIRVRHNKTLQYKNEKSNFGNNIKTAMSNWRSINEPVTQEVLTGNITIEKLEQEHFKKTLNQGEKKKQINAYWNPSIVKNRNKLSNTNNLRIFHNQIKYNLLKYCSDNLDKNKKGINKTIFDMTCGKGGDLPKWINTGYDYIVGFDKYQDSIINYEDGIYKRAYNMKYNSKSKKKFPHMIFEQADAGKNYLNGNAFLNTEKNNIGHDIIKCVTGRDYDKGYKRILSKFEGIAKDGFDVISNQFSIHYFFENIETLTGFIQNISESCKNGGYFIGTCFDGKTLFNKLKNRQNISYNSGSHKIFEINRLYEQNDDFLDDDKKSLGYAIDVYMESIGIKTKEYLVNFDYFTNIMKLYGFVLEKVEKKSIFDAGTNLFDKLIKIKSKGENIYEKINESSIEKEISFNNRYFIFRKMNIPKGTANNITRNIIANKIIEGDLLELVDHGYDILKFSELGRKKDNNFNGLPEIFKSKNSGNYDIKIRHILRSKDVKILNLTKDLLENNFSIIKQIYNEIKLKTYLVLNFDNLSEDKTLLDRIENELLKLDGIIYYGIISKLISGEYIPYLIFKKGINIQFKPKEINLFNKKMTINKSEDLYSEAKKKHEIFNKEYKFSVFNDCPLIGGTKQRALVPFISKIIENNIIYVGPSIGFAQLALAKSLSILFNGGYMNIKKKLILYFNGSQLKEEHFKITKNLVQIYDNIEINIFCNVNDITKFNKFLSRNLSQDKFNIKGSEKNLKEIKKYVKANFNNKSYYIVPFGLRFPGFVKLLSKQINKAITPDIFDKNRSDIRIWLVSGSGAILNSLYKVFPNAYFVVVQVGRTIFDDVIEKKRTTLYNYSKEMIKIYGKIYNVNFNENVENEVIDDMPYDSVKNYDAKLWPIFEKYYDEEKENFIWNVACLKTFNDIVSGFKKSSDVSEKSSVNNNFKVYRTSKTIKFPQK